MKLDWQAEDGALLTVFTHQTFLIFWLSVLEI